jgi:hypothetical protein
VSKVSRAFSKVAFAAVLLGICHVGVAGDISPTPANPQVYQGQSPYVLAPRTALVIAVPDLEDGQGLLNLKNPANDADSVTKMLQAVGFSVINVLENVGSPREMTRHNIEKGVYDFAATLRTSGGIGLIYYSGHGLQAAGQQYLYPYDGFVNYDRDLDQNLIPVSLLLDAFRAAGTSLNILVIDACRDDLNVSNLPIFGQAYRGAPASTATDSVVTVFATLSGSKALDGTGNTSPFAKSFVDSVAKTDLTLADLFGSIGIQLHGLPAIGSVKDVLNVSELPGREFVFTPTVASYNREKQIYESLTSSGQVQQMKNLLWQVPAGYFARATADWLESHPAFVNPPPPATIVVAALQDSNLRLAPTLGSAVVATVPSGKTLLATGSAIEHNGSHWFSIVGEATGAPVSYIRNDRARVVGQLPEPTTVPIAFSGGNVVGTVQVSDAAVEHLRTALGTNSQNGSSQLDVIGYSSLVDKDNHAVPSDTLLSRQAAVLSTIRELGLDASKVNVMLKRPLGSNAEDGVVVVSQKTR